jgi:hypothetical protein
LAAIGKQLSQPALEDVASSVTSDTMFAWHGQRVAQQLDGSTPRKSRGRPRIDPELEEHVLRMAHAHRSWGSKGNRQRHPIARKPCKPGSGGDDTVS